MKKLSEMNAQELSSALCEIAEPVGNLAQDDDVVKALQRMAQNKANNVIMGRMIGETFSMMIPLLLKKHKEDTFAVLSVLTGKTPHELAEENGFQLIRDARKLITSEIVSFFGSSVDMA